MANIPETIHTEVITPEEILERFNQHPIALLETYKLFNQGGDYGDVAKNAFLDSVTAGNTPESPGFSYPTLVTEELVQWRDDLTQLLDEVCHHNLNDEPTRLIRENISNRLAEVGIMLLAKMQSEWGKDDPNYEAISWQLKLNMQEVYGAPEPNHWRGILGARLAQIKSIQFDAEQSTLPPEIEDALAYINHEFNQTIPEEQPYMPKTETLQWYAARLMERCAESIELIKTAIEDDIVVLNVDNKLDYENIIRATKLVLGTRGFDAWDVQPTKDSNIDTTQRDMTIYIPETRKMSIAEFNKVIIAHEVDQHVARRVNGDRSGVAILGGLGCSDHLQWEEGAGKAGEALISGDVSLDSSAYGFFLTGGLIMGLDQPEQLGRNFGQTFDIVWRLNLLEKYNHGKLKDDIAGEVKDIQKKAYDHIRRLFRGTDGSVPGVFYPKDSVNYYQGQVEVWRKWDREMELLDDASRNKELAIERAAKINPLRHDHHRVVEASL